LKDLLSLVRYPVVYSLLVYQYALFYALPRVQQGLGQSRNILIGVHLIRRRELLDPFLCRLSGLPPKQCENPVAELAVVLYACTITGRIVSQSRLLSATYILSMAVFKRPVLVLHLAVGLWVIHCGAYMNVVYKVVNCCCQIVACRIPDRCQ
jgi:hypothetical protein